MNINVVIICGDTVNLIFLSRSRRFSFVFHVFSVFCCFLLCSCAPALISLHTSAPPVFLCLTPPALLVYFVSESSVQSLSHHPGLPLCLPDPRVL